MDIEEEPKEDNAEPMDLAEMDGATDLKPLDQMEIEPRPPSMMTTTPLEITLSRMLLPGLATPHRHLNCSAIRKGTNISHQPSRKPAPFKPIQSTDRVMKPRIRTLRQSPRAKTPVPWGQSFQSQSSKWEQHYLSIIEMDLDFDMVDADMASI